MNKLMLILFILLYVLFLCYAIVSTNKRNKENINYDFRGVVEKVSYDKKGIPYILINEKGYYLDAGYNFKKEISKGDSVSKNRGSNIYKVTKASGKVMIFKN